MKAFLTLLAIEITPGHLPGQSSNNATSSELQTIIATAFGIIGALAVLIITIAGLRYITSAGDPQKAAGAKSALTYALVGLAVAATAEGIVAFVAGQL